MWENIDGSGCLGDGGLHKAPPPFCAFKDLGVALKIKRSEGQTAGLGTHVSTYHQGKPFGITVF